MRLLIGFILGVVTATAGLVLAQSGGTWMDLDGNMGMYSKPCENCPLYYQDTHGNHGYITQQPMYGTPKPPC